MPLVTIRIARRAEATTVAQKRRLIEGITDLVADVLQKRREAVTVIIDEVDPDNWGQGGEPVSDIRARQRPR